MITRLSQLHEQLEKDLAAHRKDLTNGPLAAKAMSSARVLLNALLWETPPPSSPKRKEPEPVDLRWVFTGTAALHYLTKVCRFLNIRRTYAPDMLTVFRDGELAEVRTFLQFHLKYTEDAPLLPVDNIPVSPGHNSVKKEGSPDTFEIAQWESPLLKAHLDYERFLLAEKDGAATVTSGGNIYEFKGSQADGWEICEGLLAKDLIRINGEKPTTVSIASMWKDIFRQDIRNIYHKRRVNLGRKKEKAPLLTEMAALVTAKANQGKKKPGT